MAVASPELPPPQGFSVRIEAVACMLPSAAGLVKLTTVRFENVTMKISPVVVVEVDVVDEFVLVLEVVSPLNMFPK